MTRNHLLTCYFFILLVAAALLNQGCAPTPKITKPTPPAPAVPHPAPVVPPPAPAVPETPVHISVAYPVPGQWRPAVDSNFIFGTVQNGHASITINGYPVTPWKSGAFLAFLPMPADGEYHIVARRGTDVDNTTVSYRSRPAASEESAKSEKESHKNKLEAPEWESITKGSDTLQTGNDVAPGARTPDGNREWFFPRGARLNVVAQEGKYYKVELDKNTSAWVADSNFETPHASASPTNHSRTGFLRTVRSDIHSQRGDIFPSTGYIDLVLPCHYNPFQITAQGTSLQIHLYGASKPVTFHDLATDPLLNNVGYDSVEGGMEYTVLLSKPIWGYKAFYKPDGSLDIRVRRPPMIYPNTPLFGIRIMLDPGHPPGGAIGPTGLTEREANLAEALKLRDQLRNAGATVFMTHTDLHGVVSDYNQVEELDARTTLAVQDSVDLMVSLHNNAFPDGTDPFLNYGTSTYYYQPFSATLAGDLDREIAVVTGIPNLGAKEKSLAVCRPTWMPCALTESVYMMFPEQEADLRDPAFLDRLAEAHLRGIEDFLRERAQ